MRIRLADLKNASDRQHLKQWQPVAPLRAEKYFDDKRRRASNADRHGHRDHHDDRESAEIVAGEAGVISHKLGVPRKEGTLYRPDQLGSWQIGDLAREFIESYRVRSRHASDDEGVEAPA